MHIIDANSVMVDNFADLSSVLTENSAITHVYLGEDILMTSGIQINNNRTLIVIDGEYPLGSGTIHSLTDTGGDLGMIYKSNTSPLDISFQNIRIVGRNYYGMPRISDGNTEVAVTYRNVTYTGPQITWHWAGLTRYIDCDITIMYAGHSAVQEIGEVCRVEIGGKTIIRHNNSATTAFRFYRSESSLTILEGAEVEISTQRDLLYNTYPLPFTIQKRASLTLTTQRGISRGSAHRASSFLVDDNATFRYIQLSDVIGDAALYVDGAFRVNSGANVYMQADFTNGSATKRLLQFTSNSTARGLYINDPKSFVLYNRGPGTAMHFVASTPFLLYGGQVNFWRTAGAIPAAGSFDDPPLYPWHNPTWSKFEIKGSATSTSTSVSSSTLTAPVTPELSNLKLQEARVLSVGYLPLTVNTVVDDHTPITGSSDPLANILVEYTDAGVAHKLTGTAKDDGAFSISTPAPVPLHANVDISANVPFLYIKVQRIAQEAGELYIESAPKLIKFIVPPLSRTPICILGRSDNEPAVVIDKRVNRTKWELLVTIDKQMFCNESGRTLPGDIVFVPVNAPFDDEEPIVPRIYKRVYVGGPNDETTSVKWDDTVGILLHLTGAIHLGDMYRANLYWEVNPVEE